MKLNNRYEYNPKTDLLGSGGFGRVYLAHDTLLDMDVALKIVNADDFPEHYSLIKEVKKGISLNHTNLVRYLDAFELIETTSFGEEQNWQIAVMEYVPDGELSSIVFRGLSSEQQHNLVFQLLDGLNYLHKEGIIHRDLKPSNILLHKRNNEYIPKICDFGISKQITGKSSQLSQTIGSPSYVPPEYFDNDKRVSFGSDLWSFGVLLYELFIGTPAFGSEDSGHSTGDVLNNIINCNISSEINSISEPFQRVIRQCLVKERKERVQSCTKLIDMIKSIDQPKVFLKEESRDRSIPNQNKDVNKTKKIEEINSQNKDTPENRGYRVIFYTIGIILIFVLGIYIAKEVKDYNIELDKQRLEIVKQGKTHKENITGQNSSFKEKSQSKIMEEKTPFSELSNYIYYNVLAESDRKYSWAGLEDFTNCFIGKTCEFDNDIFEEYVGMWSARAGAQSGMMLSVFNTELGEMKLIPFINKDNSKYESHYMYDNSSYEIISDVIIVKHLYPSSIKKKYRYKNEVFIEIDQE